MLKVSSGCGQKEDFTTEGPEGTESEKRSG